MFVIGISGSPREEGNTTILVKEVMKGIEGKKKFISMADLDIHPCRSCDRCLKEKIECVINDDIKLILRELKKSDAIIFGSPTYFKSVSAQLKMLMDRSVSLYHNSDLKNKLAVTVVTHDVGSSGEAVVNTLADFYKTHKMIYAGAVVGEGGEKIGHIKEDKQAMEKAEEIARNLMEMSQRLKKG